jgi:hypothetical protein
MAIIPSVEERYAQRNAIKALPVRFLVLKNALFKSTAVVSHGFKAPLMRVQHFQELEAKGHIIRGIRAFKKAQKQVATPPVTRLPC